MKKVYDRKSGKYITEEESKKGSLKRRETCKGGRPHDWIEMLPTYLAEALPNYKGSPEPYYDAEEKIADYTARVYMTLEKEHGIKVKSRNSIWRPRMREWMCSVCHKKDYSKRT